MTVNIADSHVGGDIVAWDNSSINISIDPDSSWTGSTAWSPKTGPATNIIVDGSWELTRDTYVQRLISRRSNLDNIESNGHNVYYNPDLPENAYLGSNEISLRGGGFARPYTLEVSEIINSNDDEKAISNLESQSTALGEVESEPWVESQTDDSFLSFSTESIDIMETIVENESSMIEDAEGLYHTVEVTRTHTRTHYTTVPKESYIATFHDEAEIYSTALDEEPLSTMSIENLNDSEDDAKDD